MSDTSSKILDVGQELIQTRGYTAMSFQDIATRVGIKKPSVIHHFPSKAALGVAIIQRYRDTFASQLEAIKNDPDKTAWEALDFYYSPYLHFAATQDTVCFCVGHWRVKSLLCLRKYAEKLSSSWKTTRAG